MAQCFQVLGLPEYHVDIQTGGVLAGFEDLNGRVLLGYDIPGQVNAAEAALAQLADDLVLAEVPVRVEILTYHNYKVTVADVEAAPIFEILQVLLVVLHRLGRKYPDVAGTQQLAHKLSDIVSLTARIVAIVVGANMLLRRVLPVLTRTRAMQCL